MADTSQQFLFAVPGATGTAIVRFYSTPLGPSIVRRILVTWPPGCAGLVAVQIRAGGSAAYPNVDDSFWVFDNYTYDFTVQNQIDSGQWAVAIQNYDTLQHDIQVIYEYDYLRGVQGVSAPPPVSI